MLLTEGGEGGVSVGLLGGGGGWSWSAEMRAARVAASEVLRRVVKSAARVGGRPAMMCGGDESMVPISKVGQSPWWTLAGFVATKMLPLNQFLADFGY